MEEDFDKMEVQECNYNFLLIISLGTRKMERL